MANFILFQDADTPVVVDPVITADGEEAAVEEKRVIVQVAMSEGERGVRGRLEIDTRVHLGEAGLSNNGICESITSVPHGTGVKVSRLKTFE